MKCPRCQFDGKALVTETRHHDHTIYRRRCCSNCSKIFVTKEEVTDRMPVNGGRYKRQARPAEFTTSHLEGFWK